MNETKLNPGHLLIEPTVQWMQHDEFEKLLVKSPMEFVQDTPNMVLVRLKPESKEEPSVKPESVKEESLSVGDG